MGEYKNMESIALVVAKFIAYCIMFSFAIGAAAVLVTVIRFAVAVLRS